MTSSDKRIFAALQRAGDLMLERLQRPDDHALLQLHFTVTEAAIQDLSEIFVTPLERRDLLSLHFALLHISRSACHVSAWVMDAARQTVQLLHCLPRPKQARTACQKIYRLLWKTQAVNEREGVILHSLLHVCEDIIRAVWE